MRRYHFGRDRFGRYHFSRGHFGRGRFSRYRFTALVLALLLSFAVLGTLAACTARPEGGLQPSSLQAPGEGGTVSDAGAPGRTGLRLVTSDENFSSRKTTGNENGYYYVDRSAGVNANLRYIDYATAQDIYLSSRPEANHLTQEDDSYLSSVAGLGIAFPVGDSLFLLRTGEPLDADEIGRDALAAVFRMELDGTGRRQIYTGGGDEILLSTAAADEKDLYLIAQRTVEEEGVPTQYGYLLRIDQRTGETKELCQFSPSAFLIGAGDGLLVFHNIIDTRQENTISRTHEIFGYDVTSGTLSTIETWSQDPGTAAVVYDGMLITASPLARTVRVRALRAGEAAADEAADEAAADKAAADEAAAEYPLPDSLPADFGRLSYASCRDGHFLFWDDSTQTTYALDLATGEWSGVALKYTDPVKDDPRPVEIYAETAAQFLVCRDRASVTRRFYDPDTGTPYEIERNQPVFALIAKEDYWAGVPNYQEIRFND